MWKIPSRINFKVSTLRSIYVTRLTHPEVERMLDNAFCMVSR